MGSHKCRCLLSVIDANGRQNHTDPFVTRESQ